MINLFDKYYLDADDNQYILKIESIVQTGKNKGDKIYDSKYYVSLDSLVNGLMNTMTREKIAESDNENIFGLLIILKNIKGTMDDICELIGSISGSVNSRRSDSPVKAF